ncbi:hypothetical protein OS493_002353 [Desmophyllum pertusum]|uniref:Uncharacterized protein n=1 Tax=Desmophyllum pertusum TaxID=174260 RepID=A0A9W9YSU2_9CNID|nr:hypothetical protein OS493_002353 [Desmophyllum pertusum]
MARAVCKLGGCSGRTSSGTRRPKVTTKSDVKHRIYEPSHYFFSKRIHGALHQSLNGRRSIIKNNKRTFIQRKIHIKGAPRTVVVTVNGQRVDTNTGGAILPVQPPKPVVIPYYQSPLPPPPALLPAPVQPLPAPLPAPAPVAIPVPVPVPVPAPAPPLSDKDDTDLASILQTAALLNSLGKKEESRPVMPPIMPPFFPPMAYQPPFMGYPPGIPTRGNENQGYPAGGNENQGYPAGGNPNQGYPAGGNQNQGYPAGGNENQGYPAGGNPNQGFPAGGNQKQETQAKPAAGSNPLAALSGILPLLLPINCRCGCESRCPDLCGLCKGVDEEIFDTIACCKAMPCPCSSTGAVTTQPAGAAVAPVGAPVSPVGAVGVPQPQIPNPSTQAIAPGQNYPALQPASAPPLPSLGQPNLIPPPLPLSAPPLPGLPSQPASAPPLPGLPSQPASAPPLPPSSTALTPPQPISPPTPGLTPPKPEIAPKPEIPVPGPPGSITAPKPEISVPGTPGSVGPLKPEISGQGTIPQPGTNVPQKPAIEGPGPGPAPAPGPALGPAPGLAPGPGLGPALGPAPGPAPGPGAAPVLGPLPSGPGSPSPAGPGAPGALVPPPPDNSGPIKVPPVPVLPGASLPSGPPVASPAPQPPSLSSSIPPPSLPSLPLTRTAYPAPPPAPQVFIIKENSASTKDPEDSKSAEALDTLSDSFESAFTKALKSERKKGRLHSAPRRGRGSQRPEEREYSDSEDEATENREKEDEEGKAQSYGGSRKDYVDDDNSDNDDNSDDDNSEDADIKVNTDIKQDDDNDDDSNDNDDDDDNDVDIKADKEPPYDFDHPRHSQSLPYYEGDEHRDTSRGAEKRKKYLGFQRYAKRRHQHKENTDRDELSYDRLQNVVSKHYVESPSVRPNTHRKKHPTFKISDDEEISRENEFDSFHGERFQNDALETALLAVQHNKGKPKNFKNEKQRSKFQHYPTYKSQLPTSHDTSHFTHLQDRASNKHGRMHGSGHPTHHDEQHHGHHYSQSKTEMTPDDELSEEAGSTSERIDGASNKHGHMHGSDNPTHHDEQHHGHRYSQSKTEMTPEDELPEEAGSTSERIESASNKHGHIHGSDHPTHHDEQNHGHHYSQSKTEMTPEDELSEEVSSTSERIDSASNKHGHIHGSDHPTHHDEQNHGHHYSQSKTEMTPEDELSEEVSSTSERIDSASNKHGHIHGSDHPTHHDEQNQGHHYSQSKTAEMIPEDEILEEAGSTSEGIDYSGDNEKFAPLKSTQINTSFRKYGKSNKHHLPENTDVRKDAKISLSTVQSFKPGFIRKLSKHKTKGDKNIAEDASYGSGQESGEKEIDEPEDLN